MPTTASTCLYGAPCRTLAYWLLPSAVGLPLVARALARHRGLAPHRPTHA
jgi:hypothetical protein